MSENKVLFDVKDGIATITINVPKMSNPLDNDICAGITEAVQTCGADENIRVVVITGAGKNFCAGGDISLFKTYVDKGEGLPPSLVRSAGKMALAIRTCPKPVIAMINGAAAGAGAGLAMACDYRIVEPKSRIITAFIGLGVSTDTHLMYNLAKYVGTARALEMILCNTPIDGATALQWGLANRCAEEGTLADVTYAFAANLAKGPTYTYGKQKELMNKYLYGDLPEYSEDEVYMLSHCSETPDFSEAVYAFLEKRPATFTGKAPAKKN